MQRVSLRRHANLNRALDERDPSLIDLPIPVPSVPILSPLVTPLVGGSNSGASPPASPSPADSSPSPVTTPNGGGSGGTGNGNGSGGGSGSGGSSGGNGGSSSGGNGGSSSGGSGGGNGNGSSGGGNSGNGSSGEGNSGNGSSGGGGGGSGGGSGSNSGTGPGTGTGTGTGPGPGPGPGNGGGSGGGGDSPNKSSNTVTTTPASPQAESSPSSPPGGTPPIVNNGPGNQLNSNGGGPPMNVQGTPVVQSSSLTGNSKMSQSTSAPTASLQGSGTSSGVGSSPSDATPTLTTGAATSSHQLSSGAIGGIVVVCFLFLIGLIILFVRRRSIAHRLQRRNQWFSGYATSDSFSIVGGSMRDSQGRGSPIRNRTSARSSFATNFDQGLMFRIDSPTSPLDVDFATFGTIPELPPMAEVRERTSVLFPSASAVSRRESMNSMMSNGSDSESQYLVVTNDHNPPGLSSPMSVRPFSPSESFAFPKPPPCPNEGQCPSSLSAISGHGLASPSSSAATLVQIHSPPPIFNSDSLPSNPPASYLPPSSPLTAIPETSSNPFADPVQPKFETIRRPFAPTLNDEVAVAPGDQVLIIKVFDDGWALVEKQCGPSNDNEKGLIPVDCLREAGQPLPAFLAQKQVTSYGADPNKVGQMLAGSFHAL